MTSWSEWKEATDEFSKKINTKQLSGEDFRAYMASTYQLVETVKAICKATPDGASKVKLGTAVSAFETACNAFEKAVSTGLLDQAALDAYTHALTPFFTVLSESELAARGNNES
jgi:hypothetical protein